MKLNKYRRKSLKTETPLPDSVSCEMNMSIHTFNMYVYKTVYTCATVDLLVKHVKLHYSSGGVKTHPSLFVQRPLMERYCPEWTG